MVDLAFEILALRGQWKGLDSQGWLIFRVIISDFYRT